MPRSGSPGALLVLSLCGPLAACGAPEPGASPPPEAPALAQPERPSFERPPNLVLILADDLGYGTLASYGGREIATPQLDRMAAEGMRFLDFHAGASTCAPSRSSLMTGQHTGHTPVRSNSAYPRPGDSSLPGSAITIAELLRDAGYATAAIGKWGLGHVGTGGAPTAQGFDSFYGYLDQLLAHNSFPEFLWRNDRPVRLRNEIVPQRSRTGAVGSYATKKVDYANDLFTEEALAFIEREAARPFFLYLSYTVPHLNGEAPPGQQAEVPSLEPYAERDWPEQRKGYAAMISRLDRDVGRILRKLAELGLERDTLVLFTSDNGASDSPDVRFFAANGSLRGGKFDLYEGGIRVPLLARWPGRVPASSTSERSFAQWDVMATFADLAAVPPPPGTDGISFLPTLLGRQQPERDFLYWEEPSPRVEPELRGGVQVSKQGRWKAFHFLHTDRFELYDLEQDPGETRDVAKLHPDRLAAMQEKMRVAHSPAPDFPLLPEERDLVYRIRRLVFHLGAAGSRLLDSMRSRAQASRSEQPAES